VNSDRKGGPLPAVNGGDCTEYLLGIGGVSGRTQGIGEEYLRVSNPNADDGELA
jgi:hypothetical protein